MEICVGIATSISDKKWDFEDFWTILSKKGHESSVNFFVTKSQKKWHESIVFLRKRRKHEIFLFFEKKRQESIVKNLKKKIEKNGHESSVFLKKIKIFKLPPKIYIVVG